MLYMTHQCTHQNGELSKFWEYEAFEDSVGNDILVNAKIPDGTRIALSMYFHQSNPHEGWFDQQPMSGPNDSETLNSEFSSRTLLRSIRSIGFKPA